MKREPRVAGQFYPKAKESLLEMISRLIQPDASKEEVFGAIMPHAGYVYSGLVAGMVVSRIIPKQTFIIIGPNHTGIGGPFSIMAKGTWKTPLGDVEINEDIAAKILSNSRYVKEDESAHALEHSIEVEIPFLQYFKKDISIVPMVVSSFDKAALKRVGTDIAAAIDGEKDDIIIIASTDFTHYEEQKTAQAKDALVIDAILKLDLDAMLDIVKKEDVSMCGYAAVAVLISAVKKMGAKEARLIKYQTSGDTTGDYSSVVGYAGFVIPRK